MYELLYKVEETHWWFCGQRFLLNQFLAKYYDVGKNLVLLDVGCGTGFTLSFLDKFGETYGIDVSNEAIEFCKDRGTKNVKKSDVMDIQFESNRFDVVTSLGVFYHKNVVDDVLGMKEIHRVLKPGGRLFFYDSAMMSLFGNHDLAFHGVRRYSRKDLKSKLVKSGFVVEKISYANAFLFLPVHIKRKLEKLGNPKAQSDIQDTINPLLNSLLASISKFEIKLMRYINYPFGINLFAVAVKY